MKHSKEKKHTRICFNKRLNIYLDAPDDDIPDYVPCDRCSNYLWFGVNELKPPVEPVFPEPCAVCNRNAFSCECPCTCTDKECEEIHVNT